MLKATYDTKAWDEAIKRGIQFVITRVQDNTVLDRNLKANVQAFHRLGIRYGLYAYVEASTAAQAHKEAESGKTHEGNIPPRQAGNLCQT